MFRIALTGDLKDFTDHVTRLNSVIRVIGIFDRSNSLSLCAIMMWC